MTDAATIAANRQRAREYFRAFATQDRAWLEANVAPTYVRRDTTLPFEVVGPEGVLKLGDVLLGAFSEVELDIQDTVAEGDKVLVHLRFRGVHSGPFGDYPASDRRFDAMVLDLFRMENGQIAEQWPAIDNIGLQQQIGMLRAEAARRDRGRRLRAAPSTPARRPARGACPRGRSRRTTR